MAASDLVDIFNAAVLNATSKGSINSIAEPSAEAAVCAQRYPSIVRAILRDTDWNCLRRRVGLLEVTAGAVSPPSWTYMYAYPEDCLVVRGFDFGLTAARFPNWTQVDYEVADDATAGKVILTNVACPVMIYTSYVLDLISGTYEGKFDSLLREAVGWGLAAAICGPLTGNRAIAGDVRAQAKIMLDQAKAANANESSPNRMPQDCDSIMVRGAGDMFAPDWRGFWPGTF
jgi:hypothetical protein